MFLEYTYCNTPNEAWQEKLVGYICIIDIDFCEFQYNKVRFFLWQYLMRNVIANMCACIIHIGSGYVDALQT